MEIPLSADELSAILLSLPRERGLAMLDSCGSPHLGSHLFIAGIDPVNVTEVPAGQTPEALAAIEMVSSTPGLAAIMTLSYDLGARMNHIEVAHSNEPDVYLAQYDTLFVHDYNTGKSFLTGDASKFETRLRALAAATESEAHSADLWLRSNFSKDEYCAAIEAIREHIRNGDTYQANLTRQIEVHGLQETSLNAVYTQLRRRHPAAFSSVIRRGKGSVLSASPERFFRVENGEIIVSPIKGTRPRGHRAEDDVKLRAELTSSEKDRAENIMIVDLMRNDIGRICEFGTVRVEKLCDVEEHASLFHLVSTVRGRLRKETTLPDIIRALFPCGSITGAPKIRTMQIINELEPCPRGLSMGAIGYVDFEGIMDFSVAIRTMVWRDGKARFNVGGGITIDSIPEKEWEETEVKSRALLSSIGFN